MTSYKTQSSKEEQKEDVNG